MYCQCHSVSFFLKAHNTPLYRWKTFYSCIWYWWILGCFYFLALMSTVVMSLTIQLNVPISVLNSGHKLRSVIADHMVILFNFFQEPSYYFLKGYILGLWDTYLLKPPLQHTWNGEKIRLEVSPISTIVMIKLGAINPSLP